VPAIPRLPAPAERPPRNSLVAELERRLAAALAAD
jgi:hypothetical protein